ncbi:hypothetical protein Pelo_8356 [Pelomyxa schiedti]|nr:hypothetical protein Pelo_8356 [Pelomyxa schiedti]
MADTVETVNPPAIVGETTPSGATPDLDHKQKTDGDDTSVGSSVFHDEPAKTDTPVADKKDDQKEPKVEVDTEHKIEARDKSKSDVGSTPRTETPTLSPAGGKKPAVAKSTHTAKPDTRSPSKTSTPRKSAPSPRSTGPQTTPRRSVSSPISAAKPHPGPTSTSTTTTTIPTGSSLLKPTKLQELRAEENKKLREKLENIKKEKTAMKKWNTVGPIDHDKMFPPVFMDKEPPAPKITKQVMAEKASANLKWNPTTTSRHFDLMRTSANDRSYNSLEKSYYALSVASPRIRKLSSTYHGDDFQKIPEIAHSPLKSSTATKVGATVHTEAFPWLTPRNRT